MFTVVMEIKNGNSHNRDFYVPASKDFKKYPRTIDGIKKAINELYKNLKNEELCIIDFNIIVYEGRVYYYTRDKKVVMKLDKNSHVINELLKENNGLFDEDLIICTNQID